MTGRRDLIDDNGFKNALYMIDIGQNDLLLALYDSNLTYSPVVQKIPSMLLEIKKAIQVPFFFSQIIIIFYICIKKNCYPLNLINIG